MPVRAAVIIILGFIAYGCMLKAPFKTMDDRISIIENPLIKSMANVPEVFRQGYFHDQYYYRPLPNLSFMGEYHLFGLHSFYYNLDNLILHILNALLVVLLVTRLTGSEFTGFWTGLLFVLHPIQWEAVCNISGRVILMSAFFGLATFILFWEFYRHRRWWCLPAAMITFALSLLCKESAGVLPAVLVVYMFLDKKSSWPRKGLVAVLFAAVIIGYIGLRHYMGITKLFHTDDPLLLVLGFVTFLRSVITDLRLFILPVDLHFDRCLPYFMSLADPSAVFAMVFWLVVLAVLLAARKRIATFGFFLVLWFCIELLPVSQLVAGIGVGTGHVSTAEHFLYVAAIPVFTGMVMAFTRLYRRNAEKNFVDPGLLKFAAGGFLCFLLLTAVEQSLYASNEYSMLSRSLAYDPDNPRIQGAMALLSVFRNDIPDAENHFRQAIRSDPFNPDYHISLGTALCQQEHWIEGLEQYVVFDPGKQKNLVERQEKLTMAHINRQLAEGKTFDSRGWLAIGIYYAKHGQNGPAIEAFVKSAGLNPRQGDAWFNLGSIYEAEHNWAASRAAYRKLLEIRGISDFQRNYASEHLLELKHKQ